MIVDELVIYLILSFSVLAVLSDKAMEFAQLHILRQTYQIKSAGEENECPGKR